MGKPPKIEKEPNLEEIAKQVNELLNARREATGIYKASVQNLLNSVNNLFKIDDTIFNLVLKKKE